MSNIIFARPRYDYDSYGDLYRLIALSGYPLVYFDEIQPDSDNMYILTMVNGENQNGYPGATAEIILYDLEWRLNGEYPSIPGVGRVWAADAWYAGRIGAQYVPVGSHPDLPNSPLVDCPKVWDVALLAYLSPRRQALHNAMQGSGIRLAPRGWGLERHEILQQTIMTAQIHQLDNAATIAPQRFALAAAYKLPMVCETVADRGIFDERHALWCDYGQIIPTIERWRGEAALGEYGTALHELLCVERTFRANIEAAL